MHSPPAPLMVGQNLNMDGYGQNIYNKIGPNPDDFYSNEMGQEGMGDSQALEDERMRAEENIYNTHLDAVKEEVQLIQREGEMITTLERAIKNEEDYDMRDYLENARAIAIQKI